ncbi:nephrin-like, partial [Tropilaelaps mercedesae]
MRGPLLVQAQLLSVLLQLPFLALRPQSQVISAVSVQNEYANDVTTVRAVVGGRAHLPCNIEVPFGANDTPNIRGRGAISLILWYHGNNHSRGGIPIHSLDALDQPLLHAQQWPSAEFSNRAHFDVIARPPVLKLDPVMESDAGEYRCRVDYTGERSQNRMVRLDIIVPPSEIRILDSFGRRVSGVIGPYDEGSSLTLVCETTNAKPRARISWLQDGALIDDSDYVTPDHPQKLVSNKLFIKRLDRSHLLATFICQARNEIRDERRDFVKRPSFPVLQPSTLRTANVTIDMN